MTPPQDPPVQPGHRTAVAPVRFPVWVTLLLCLGAALFYLPVALHAEFLNFDDNLFFGPDNPEFRDGGLGAIFDPRRTIANVYLPVSHLSLYLDYQLFGGDPLGPHLVSLLLHALAGLCLVRWLLRMGIRSGAAHVTGLLFLLHPALCESVSWVSSRKDLLSGLFVFLALGLTARFARAPRRTTLVGIAALGVLALYSKATAVVLPGLAVLVCLYTGGPRRRWWAPLVLAAVTLPIAWHHFVLAAGEGTLAVTAGGGEALLARAAQAPGALLHYLETSFAPRSLNVLYPEVDTLGAFRSRWLPGTLVLLAVLAAGHFLWRSRWRASALGVLLLLVALLPFNTFYPASSVAAADRYLYLALPGAALAVVGLGRAGVLLGAVLIAPVAWLTLDRSMAFASSEAVWQASLAAAPENAVAKLNLAQDLQARRLGEVTQRRQLLEGAVQDARYPQHRFRAERELLAIALAESRYEAAVQHAAGALSAVEQLPPSPTRAVLLLHAMIHLAEAQRLAGRDAEALATTARMEALAPGAPAVVATRALLLLREVIAEHGMLPVGDPRVAVASELLREPLVHHADDPLINRAAGSWEQARGNRMSALRYFRRAIRIAPSDPEGYVGAAEVCLSAGLYEEAEDYALAGLAQRREEPRLLQLRALSLSGQNRLDDAIASMERYAALRPRDRNAARVLSNLLMGKALSGFGDRSHAELEDLISRAQRWYPGEPKVDIVRGRMLRERRQWQQAIEHLERAAVRFPDQEDVRRSLADSWSDLGYERKFKGDREGAADAWLRFLELASPDQPADAARLQLQAESRRVEASGVVLLEKGEAVAAERSFRRSLLLDPDSHSAAWFLAAAVASREDADFAEVDRLLEQAIAGRQRGGLDCSWQVLLRVQTLQRLGRTPEARTQGARFLAEQGGSGDIEAIELLRRAVAALGDGK